GRCVSHRAEGPRGRIVDENVERSELRRQLADGSHDGIWLADVGVTPMKHGARDFRGEVSCRLTEHLPVSVDETEPGALASEQPRRGITEPAGRPGNNGGLSQQAAPHDVNSGPAKPARARSPD